MDSSMTQSVSKGDFIFLSQYSHSVTHCLMKDGCYNYFKKNERKKKSREKVKGKRIVPAKFNI